VVTCSALDVAVVGDAAIIQSRVSIFVENRHSILTTTPGF
jgi:hypothetical protein